MRCEKCPSDERTDKTEHIGKLIHELDNILYRNMLAIGKRYDYDQLTVMNGWILHYLSMNEGKEVFQKDIENEFGITRSTVTGIIKLMEQKGFITRISVPKDARLKQLVLTDMGRKYEEQMGSQMRQNNLQLQKNITEEEMETFLRVIDKIKQNVKE
ncbi:MAG: MarR family transcriptional regulator [Lachnospiraceae bacterium]